MVSNLKKTCNCLIGFVLLGAASSLLFPSQQIQGRTVIDPSILAIRGSGCEHRFTYDNANPLFCSGSDVGCSMTIPLLQGLGKSGSGEFSCGAAAGCGTYTGPSDCAQVATEITSFEIVNN